MRFQESGNLTVRFGAVFRYCKSYGAVRCCGISHGAVRCFHVSYGAVRCGFQTSGILWCGSVLFSDIIVSYGAVRCCDKSYDAVRCGSPLNGFCYVRCGANPRMENRTKPRFRTVLKLFLAALTKPLFLYGAPYE